MRGIRTWMQEDGLTTLANWDNPHLHHMIIIKLNLWNLSSNKKKSLWRRRWNLHNLRGCREKIWIHLWPILISVEVSQKIGWVGKHLAHIGRGARRLETLSLENTPSLLFWKRLVQFPTERITYNMSQNQQVNFMCNYFKKDSSNNVPTYI